MTCLVVMSYSVLNEICPRGESLVAKFTGERLCSAVDSFVADQVTNLERLKTKMLLPDRSFYHIPHKYTV